MALTCPVCQRSFVPKRARRDVRYCSTSCRVRAFQARRLAEQKKEWIEDVVRRIRGEETP